MPLQQWATTYDGGTLHLGNATKAGTPVIQAGTIKLGGTFDSEALEQSDDAGDTVQPIMTLPAPNVYAQATDGTTATPTLASTTPATVNVPIRLAAPVQVATIGLLLDQNTAAQTAAVLNQGVSLTSPTMSALGPTAVGAINDAVTATSSSPSLLMVLVIIAAILFFV